MYPVYRNIGTKENCEVVKVNFPPQHQDCHPGLEYLMDPRPISDNANYKGSDKLKDKVAIITGGDSGIGRAVAYAFAKEGANIVIAYLNEDEDAKETCEHVETLGRQCIAIKGDLQKEENCKLVIEEALHKFGKIDILVNNHAVQYIQQSILDIDEEQLEKTSRTNIFSFFNCSTAGSDSSTFTGICSLLFGLVAFVALDVHVVFIFSAILACAS